MNISHLSVDLFLAPSSSATPLTAFIAIITTAAFELLDRAAAILQLFIGTDQILESDSRLSLGGERLHPSRIGDTFYPRFRATTRAHATHTHQD